MKEVVTLFTAVVAFNFFFTSAFRVLYASRSSRRVWCSSATAGSTNLATLDPNTLWRLSFKLQKSGFKDIEAAVQLRFIDTKNYEPPQGRIFVEDDYSGICRVDEKGFSSRWTLSEDKDDRKDGLWIWGLFKEPQYPFLYFSLGIFPSIILPSGEEEPIFGGAGVPKNRLDFRFAHARESGSGGVVLSDGQITYQTTELVKADPLGLGGTVDVGDSVSAGSVSINPVFTRSAPTPVSTPAPIAN